MTYANPDDGRELPSLPPRRVASAVFASLALHGAVLMLLARVTMNDADPGNDASAPQSIGVALVTRAPRQALPPEPTPPDTPDAASAPDIPAADTLPDAEALATPPPTEPLGETPREPADTPASASAGAAPARSEGQRNEGQRSAAERLTDDEAPGQPWTQARLRAALDTSRREQQSETTASWLTGCIIEQKQRGTRDCTRQQQAFDYATDNMRAGRAAAAGSFASVTRPQLHARLSEQFRRENLGLAELMEAGGEVGALATQRHYINLEYFRYLNGNGQDPMFSAMQNFSADVLGGSSLSLPGNVPFTCSKRRTSFAIGEKGKATGVPTPCIYEWTGFTIERPETNDADAFRVVPVVPRSDANQPAMPVTP